MSESKISKIDLSILALITDSVCRTFDLTIEQLIDWRGQSRDRNLAMARTAAMYLTSANTDIPKTRIAQLFGTKNAITVRDAVKRVKFDAYKSTYLSNFIDFNTHAIHQHRLTKSNKI